MLFEPILCGELKCCSSGYSLTCGCKLFKNLYFPIWLSYHCLFTAVCPTCDVSRPQFACFSHTDFTTFPRAHTARSWLWPACGGWRRLLHEQSWTITLPDSLFKQQGVAVLSGVRPLAADEEQKAGAPDVPSPRYICRMLNHQLSVTVSGSLRALWLPLPLLWKLSALSNTHTHTLTHAHTPPASLLWPVLSVLMKAVTSVWRWQWVLIWVCVSVFVRTCVSSTRAATPAYKHANGAVKGMLNSSPCCLMLK